MRRVRPTILAGVFALGTTACDAAIGPRQEISLIPCTGVTWAAFRNAGGEWTPVDPAAPSTLRVTPTLQFAVVRAGNMSASLEVFHLSAAQVDTLVSCRATVGQPRLAVNGTITGAGVDDFVYIRIGDAIGYRYGSGPFSVSAVAPGPVDLVATRQVHSAGAMAVPRMIVRRGQSFTEGASIPLLDFDAAEAFSPESHTLNVTGVPPTLTVGAQTDFITRSGTLNPIGGGDLQGTTLPIYSVPAARRRDDDMHLVTVGSSARNVHFAYRGGGDRTISLGPEAATPDFLRSSATPQRVTVLHRVAPEHGSWSRLVLSQQTTTYFSVALTGTREYFDAGATSWSMQIPDLAQLPGFRQDWALQAGAVSWSLFLTGRPIGFSTATLRDGDLFYSAFRLGDLP